MDPFTFPDLHLKCPKAVRWFDGTPWWWWRSRWCLAGEFYHPLLFKPSKLGGFFVLGFRWILHDLLTMYPKNVGNWASELLNSLSWRNVLGLMLKGSGFQDSALTDYDSNIGPVRRNEISIPNAHNKGKKHFEWSIAAQETTVLKQVRSTPYSHCDNEHELPPSEPGSTRGLARIYQEWTHQLAHKILHVLVLNHPCWWHVNVLGPSSSPHFCWPNPLISLSYPPGI